MLSNYIKIALRNLWRHRGYAFINVSGLAIGMACCLLIVLYVRDELSYDKFHDNADNIARLVRSRSAYTAAPMGPALAADFAEVKHATRLQVYEEVLVHDGAEKRFTESVIAADSNFFDTFSFPLVYGDKESVLSRPDALVLTESAARKYFGTTDALGRTLILEDGGDSATLTVTGVLRDLPSNSHFQFDLLASFALVEQTSNRLENWSTNWLFTYLRLEDGASVQSLQQQLPDFFERHTGESRSDMRIQRLRDIHLNSAELELDIAPQGSLQYLLIFSAVALLVLVIACINFMNLSTARSSLRSREVGLRKVMGAKRQQLVSQFMGESLVLAFLALGLSIGIVYLALPAFGSIAGKDLSLLAGGVTAGGDAAFLVAVLLGMTSVVGVLAGTYPAIFLSGFRAIDTMRGSAGSTRTAPRGGFLRRGLVVFQFGVSTFLIVATLVVVQQLDYVRSARLGFAKEQVVVLPIGSDLGNAFETVKAQFGENPRVLGVSATGNVPGRGVSDFFYRPAGLTGTTDDLPGWDTYFIDEDFVETLQLEIVEGRGLSRERDAVTTGSEEGSGQAYLLNEAAVARAVELAGDAWSDPVGKQLEFYLPGSEGWQVFNSGTVVGVVRDFHYRSMREEIGPLVLQAFPRAFGTLLVKISTEDVGETLSFLEAKWQSLGIAQPFDYHFLDDSYDQLYEADARMGKLFGYLAGLTIVIACMGLFGLAAFMAERRTKEIGIRRTLGASVSGITILLSREYAVLIAVAFALAAPTAYFAMNSWLEGFAYHYDLSALVFVVAGVAVLLISLLTVSYQSIRAATTDPVKALRYE